MMEQLETLLADGMAALERGDYAKAESRFRSVALASHAPEAYENWAFCRLAVGDYDGVLDVLATSLAAKAPLPLGRSIASMAHRALGRADAAKMAMLAAVRDVDKLLAGRRRGDGLDPEYLGAVCQFAIQAACELGSYRQALELYGRWPVHQVGAASLYAGFAAFSLRRYDRAVNLWLATIDDTGCGTVASAMISIASLVKEGLVPHFAIDAGSAPRGSEASGTIAKRAASQGDSPPTITVDQCLALAELMRLKDDPFFSDSSVFAAADLFAATGEWGFAAAKGSLLAPQVPLSMKLGALSALSAAGAVRPGDSVTLVRLDRRWRFIHGSLAPLDVVADVLDAYDGAIRSIREGRNV